MGHQGLKYEWMNEQSKDKERAEDKRNKNQTLKGEAKPLAKDRLVLLAMVARVPKPNSDFFSKQRQKR